MSQPSQVQGDLQVVGNLSCAAFYPPANCITPAAIAAGGPGAGIPSTAVQMRNNLMYRQISTANAAVDRQVVYRCNGTSATVVKFGAGAVTAAIGAATATIDLKKNGTTILSASISLTNATAAYALALATIASAGLVTGDVLEVHVTAATAGGGTLAVGLFCELVIDEYPL